MSRYARGKEPYAPKMEHVEVPARHSVRIGHFVGRGGLWLRTQQPFNPRDRLESGGSLRIKLRGDHPAI